MKIKLILGYEKKNSDVEVYVVSIFSSHVRNAFV